MRSRRPVSKKKHLQQDRGSQRAAVAPPVPRAQVVYGEAFVVLEDQQKGTFVFEGGAWVPHSQTIAECQRDCQVTKLAQKVNNMTRYEVRSPI